MLSTSCLFYFHIYFNPLLPLREVVRTPITICKSVVPRVTVITLLIGIIHQLFGLMQEIVQPLINYYARSTSILLLFALLWFSIKLRLSACG